MRVVCKIVTAWSKSHFDPIHACIPLEATRVCRRFEGHSFRDLHLVCLLTTIPSQSLCVLYHTYPYPAPFELNARPRSKHLPPPPPPQDFRFQVKSTMAACWVSGIDVQGADVDASYTSRWPFTCSVDHRQRLNAVWRLGWVVHVIRTVLVSRFAIAVPIAAHPQGRVAGNSSLIYKARHLTSSSCPTLVIRDHQVSSRCYFFFRVDFIRLVPFSR